MALTHEEKMELAKKLPGYLNAGDFRPPPSIARGREVVRWEDRLPLEEFRKHKGMGAAILDEMEGDKATASVRNMIVGRLSKVFPGESWVTYVSDGWIWLKFNGERKGRG